MLRFQKGDLDHPRLPRTLYEAVAAKDLLIHVNDLDLDAQSGFPWSGALQAGSGDALMIVNSNLGFNRIDGTIQSGADYSISLDSDPIKATLTITCTNLCPATTNRCELRPIYPPSYAELQQGCHWTYVRVAAPKGSEMISTSGLEDVTTEILSEGRTIFDGYFVLPRGESKTVQFEYHLPPKLKNVSRYTLLLLEKQPGEGAIAVSVRITIPAIWFASSNYPPVGSIRNLQDISIILDHGLVI